MRVCSSPSSPTAHIAFCTLDEVLRPQILITASSFPFSASCPRRSAARSGALRPGHDAENGKGFAMSKIWGRNTSSNVQKAMWAVGELGLEHTRIDVGGAFGKNKEPPYLAMNPNGLVPTLEEEDGFLLWESNSVVRYLAGKHDTTGALEPKDAKQRALASQWMDWQLSVVGPAIFHAFWGLIRTPTEKRDMAAIKTSQDKTTECMVILDQQLAKNAFLAGPAFSYG